MQWRLITRRRMTTEKESSLSASAPRRLLGSPFGVMLAARALPPLSGRRCSAPAHNATGVSGRRWRRHPKRHARPQGPDCRANPSAVVRRSSRTSCGRCQRYRSRRAWIAIFHASAPIRPCGCGRCPAPPRWLHQRREPYQLVMIQSSRAATATSASAVPAAAGHSR
jgi:hypothetical protein